MFLPRNMAQFFVLRKTVRGSFNILLWKITSWFLFRHDHDQNNEENWMNRSWWKSSCRHVVASYREISYFHRRLSHRSKSLTFSTTRTLRVEEKVFIKEKLFFMMTLSIHKCLASKSTKNFYILLLKSATKDFCFLRNETLRGKVRRCSITWSWEENEETRVRGFYNATDRNWSMNDSFMMTKNKVQLDYIISFRWDSNRIHVAYKSLNLILAFSPKFSQLSLIIV